MTNRPSRRDQIAQFRRLHEVGCFVLPNPWDIGSTLYLEHLGFKALATTSAGYCFSYGRADGGVTRDQMLSHIREITGATSLPVNADYLNGFADDPEGVAKNVTLCLETGVAGLSIEDSTGRETDPLYEETLARARIQAARKAIDKSDTKAVLTARCEAFLVGHSNPLPFVLNRLAIYAEEGADCLYAPGVTELDDIAEIVRTVAPKPVNVLVSAFNSNLTLSQLADLGVRRISVGSGLAMTAWSAFADAAREIIHKGSFERLVSTTSFAELNELFTSRS